MTDRYNRPKKGTEEWHQPLNSNFRNLDIDVEHRGEDANRDTVDPVEGAKYLSTDTGDIYIGTGSSWDHLGTLTPDSEALSKPNYVTLGDETDTLPNSDQHATLAGSDLHDPATHDHTGDALSPDSVNTTNFTINGVTFWVSDTEPADAAADDVWIETNWQS